MATSDLLPILENHNRSIIGLSETQKEMMECITLLKDNIISLTARIQQLEKWNPQRCLCAPDE